MQFKSGVTIQGAKPVIWYCAGVCEAVFVNHGSTMVVTSMTDSHEDRPASLHNQGLAVDLRTRHVSVDTLRLILATLRRILEPKGFDVVLESDHLHIEFQPKGKEHWQEMETV